MGNIRIRKLVAFALLSILTLGLVVIITKLSVAAIESPQLTFSVSGCNHYPHLLTPLQSKSPQQETTATKSASAKDIVVKAKDDHLVFSHSLGYVCCADITLESEIDNNVITVVEVNQGNSCRCHCEYVIDASFGPLEKGTYDLRVYGVRYKDDNNQQLLFESKVDIK